MKKNIVITLMLAFVCVIAACNNIPDIPTTPDTLEEPQGDEVPVETPDVSVNISATPSESDVEEKEEEKLPEPKPTRLIVELTDQDATLVTEAIEKYIALDMLDEKNKHARPGDFLNPREKIDEEVPLTLSISMENASAKCYKIELSENGQFTDVKEYYIEGEENSYSFSHLYTNTEYFYKVTAYTDNGIFEQTGNFKTADTPRILSVEGIHNVRDIGNWKTDSGERIKQGLLFRGTTMDGAVESTYLLTRNGVVDMLTSFGIKTEIDLRLQTDKTKDVLGISVDHRYYNMVMYDDVFTATGKKRVRAVFSDLADPTIYPAYIHCTYGMDRAGTVSYLLEALLGVSQEDCRTEYGLSNPSVKNLIPLEDGLAKYEGETLKEQTENFLIDCGITKEEIESIRNIFLGE